MKWQTAGSDPAPLAFGLPVSPAYPGFARCAEKRARVSIHAASAVVILLCLTATANAAIRPVNAGGDLQAVLNAAQPGDEVVIQAGARFVGNFQLPPKPTGPAITVRSSATLPQRRITPADMGLMPTLAPVGVEPVLSCQGTSRGWVLRGLNLESNQLGIYDLVGLDGGCSDIVFDRSIIIGGPNGQKRGIRANGSHITVTRSHLANIWAEGQDSQAICGWDGAGPFTITDNFLEAAGENVMFGGAASSSPAKVPADILVEGNTFSKRLEWQNPSHPASVKNLFELKAAKRAIVRNNTFERNWTDAQNGYAILFTVRNDDGNCDGCTVTSGAPWTVVEDVLFEGNTIRDVEHGINILGYDSYGASGRATRIVIRNNTVQTAGTFLQVGGEVGTLTVDHNTVDNGYTFMSLYAGGVWVATEGQATGRTARWAVENFTVTNNLANHNDYGLMGEDSGIGTPGLERQTATYRWTNNALAGHYPYAYPMETRRPTPEEHAAQFQAFALPYQLKATSTYRLAATDGADLGRVLGLLPTVPAPRSPSEFIILRR